MCPSGVRGAYMATHPVSELGTPPKKLQIGPSILPKICGRLDPPLNPHIFGDVPQSGPRLPCRVVAHCGEQIPSPAPQDVCGPEGRLIKMRMQFSSHFWENQHGEKAVVKTAAHEWLKIFLLRLKRTAVLWALTVTLFWWRVIIMMILSCV